MPRARSNTPLQRIKPQAFNPYLNLRFSKGSTHIVQNPDVNARPATSRVTLKRLTFFRAIYSRAFHKASLAAQHLQSQKSWKKLDLY